MNMGKPVDEEKEDGVDQAVLDLLKTILARRSAGKKRPPEGMEEELESPWGMDEPPSSPAMKAPPMKMAGKAPPKKEDHPMENYAKDGRRRRL